MKDEPSLRESNSFEEEDTPLLEDIKLQGRLAWARFRWELYTVFVVCVASVSSFSVGFFISHASSSWGSYEMGFKSDYSLPFQQALRQIRFTGSPRFYDNGTAWRPEVNRTAMWPDNETYFGTPSVEIDRAWEKLYLPFQFPISEEDAKAAFGETYMKYKDEQSGKYFAGLDVFHTLHCVDFIRRAFYLDQYPFDQLHGPVHLEHCLDIIRQSIQCYGSTTLIATKYYAGVGHIYIDADQIHTCRDIRELRTWVDDRQKSGRYYQDQEHMSSIEQENGQD